ncbi:DER1-domain-containing protein [Aureobasidium namibiae CBS 147.97]|uniref:Derlin n=1 Tax=Aureobasidium namibiae CBS 147.97 TaxID=1043004 RepID=A0A074WR74_9PEZI|nr:DER1-domain-containing protein [Aureobasidium namibiae CBS 147.97]KEQ75618.1 DER1-domain-containing protein [Aureobasidium namibiae CBS 147.97]
MLGAAGGGDLGALPLEQWFFEMPVCTRWWTTATIVTGLLVQCHILTPFQLFYSFRAVFVRSQYWRLLTTFIYFGPLSLNLLFHIFFIQRYARMLEESAVSQAHFTWMLCYAITTLLCLAPLVSVVFLGSILSSTLVYIWSRKHPDVQLSFLGLFVFRAPWLPWVMIGLSVVMHGNWPKDELCGIAVGHVYYFFNDIYPANHNGQRPLDPPLWWQRLIRGSAVVDAELRQQGRPADTAAAAAPAVQLQ